MQSSVGAGNYTKIYEADPYQSYPESVDWRTKDAVTSVKDQACLMMIFPCLIVNCMDRVSVGPAMHSVRLQPWKELMH